MRILIADDHALVREGLRLIIESQLESKMQVIGEATDGEQAWKLTRDLLPDLVLMDVSMPQLSGLQATERIRTSCPSVKVLAVSAYRDEGHIRQLLAAGASGYVLKHAVSKELIQAIGVVKSGGLYLDPTIAVNVAGGYVNPQPGERTAADLSPRELEVFMELAWGHTNREIAQKLEVSVKTIEGHKNKIGQKMGLTTRAAIVRYALRRGWLNED